MDEEIRQFLKQLAEELPAIQPQQNLTAVAEVLIDCVIENKTESFYSIFDRIEHVLIYGSDDLRKAIIIELLENLKNFCIWRNFDYVIFENWLHPETHLAWRWLEKRWQGKDSLQMAASKGTSPD